MFFLWLNMMFNLFVSPIGILSSP